MAIDEADVAFVSALYVTMGAGSIQDFTSTARGRKAGEIYERELRKFLQAYPWHCTKKRYQCARDETNPPINRWAYAYELPGDRLGPSLVMYDSEGGRRPYLNWELVGNRIETDAGYCFIVYQTQIPLAEMEAHVEEAWQGWLGSKLVEGVVSTDARAQLWEQRKAQWMMEAQHRDASLHPARKVEDYVLVQARFGHIGAASR